jgi:DNA helicase-2/ATP-dependent DNA helicase PcrA
MVVPSAPRRRPYVMRQQILARPHGLITSWSAALGRFIAAAAAFAVAAATAGYLAPPSHTAQRNRGDGRQRSPAGTRFITPTPTPPAAPKPQAPSGGAATAPTREENSYLTPAVWLGSLTLFGGLVVFLMWRDRRASLRFGEVNQRHKNLLGKYEELAEAFYGRGGELSAAGERNRRLGGELARRDASMKALEERLRPYARLPHLLRKATQADLDYFFRHAPGGADSVSPDDLLRHLERVAASSLPPPLPQPAPEPPKAGPKAFVPSIYQDEIFKWIKGGSGDAIIHAVAGAGKTTTLVEASKLIDTKRAIFLAFNTSIAEELGSRLKDMSAKTIHGLGMGLIRRHFNVKARGGDEYKDDYKYLKLLREHFRGQGVGVKRVKQFERGLAELLNFARLTLTDPHDAAALKGLIDRYSIAIGPEHLEMCVAAVAPILDEGVRRAARRVDYTDMVWLPNVLDLRGAAAYDWIFVDEAQDLNAAQRGLVLKSRAASGRILFVGDPRQAIYGFAGADSHSMEQISEETGAQELPLSVCYRCPTSHVSLARRLVPHIEAAPGAATGILERPYVHQAVGQMKPGDLVISRCSAPLARVYAELRKARVPAYIVGENLKGALLHMVGQISRRPGFYIDRFPKLLAAYLDEQSAALRKDHPDPEAAEFELRDRGSTVETIYRSSMPKDVEAFTAAIEEIYSEQNPDEAVRCSTIHRAKGLEAERVFLVAPHLLPHPKAGEGWQKEQEYNLEYVAYTRSKYFLAICTGEL